MAHVYLQGLLFLVLLIVTTQGKGDSTVTEAVSASKEGDALLPCFSSTVMDPKSCYRVRLLKYHPDSNQIVMSAWPSKIQDAKRVKWRNDGNGNVSLYLTNVTNSDEGLYSCQVCQGWECTLVKNISLKVKDCKTSPPVRATPGTAIKLNCSDKSGSGQQKPENISWAKLKGGTPVPLKINVTSLLINSVNDSDEGWYRCNYTSGQTQRCLEINLLVQDVKTTVVPVTATTTQQAPTTSDSGAASNMNESSGTLTAVVASAIVGIVICAALTGLFFYCRHNTLTVTQRPQRRLAGAVRQSVDCYEIVDLTERPTVQQDNSLYHQYEGNMCTFQQ